jgi:hypothetical protein
VEHAVADGCPDDEQDRRDRGEEQHAGADEAVVEPNSVKPLTDSPSPVAQERNGETAHAIAAPAATHRSGPSSSPSPAALSATAGWGLRETWLRGKPGCDG